MEKITIVGPGRVGESTAQILAKEELAREIVLLGREEGVAEGIALDIQESAPVFGFDTKVRGGNDPAILEGSNLVIVTAGFPRKPGMSRSDVLDANISIIAEITDNIMRYSPEAKILMVTNPVDVLTYYAWKKTGWSRERVFGLSGALDTARMVSFIALETGFSVRDISALVLGGHGDAMVPLPRFTHVSGIPLEQFLSAETIAHVSDHTRRGGAEILALKRNSSAYDAPAAAAAAMVDAICYDRKRILPCVCILDGQYDQYDIALGVPGLLGEGGLERVIQLSLNAEEHAQFEKSAHMVRADIGRVI